MTAITLLIFDFRLLPYILIFGAYDTSDFLQFSVNSELLKMGKSIDKGLRVAIDTHVEIQNSYSHQLSDQYPRKTHFENSWFHNLDMEYHLTHSECWQSIQLMDIYLHTKLHQNLTKKCGRTDECTRYIWTDRSLEPFYLSSLGRSDEKKICTHLYFIPVKTQQMTQRCQLQSVQYRQAAHGLWRSAGMCVVCYSASE